MYNTKQVAEMIFDKLKNNINLTDKEKQNKIKEISDLLLEEHNKVLSLLDVSNMFCSHCGKRKRTRSGYIEPLCECNL